MLNSYSKSTFSEHGCTAGTDLPSCRMGVLPWCINSTSFQISVCMDPPFQGLTDFFQFSWHLGSIDRWIFQPELLEPHQFSFLAAANHIDFCESLFSLVRCHWFSLVQPYYPSVYTPRILPLFIKVPATRLRTMRRI